MAGPQLVDTMLGDAFREGVDEERRMLGLMERPTAEKTRQRVRLWEQEIAAHARRVEQLHGRLAADRQWLDREGGA